MNTKGALLVCLLFGSTIRCMELEAPQPKKNTTLSGIDWQNVSNKELQRILERYDRQQDVEFLEREADEIAWRSYNCLARVLVGCLVALYYKYS